MVRQNDVKSNVKSRKSRFSKVLFDDIGFFIFKIILKRKSDTESKINTFSKRVDVIKSKDGPKSV